jgi:hypothetical protein
MGSIPNPVTPIITAVSGPLMDLLLFLVVLACAIGFAHGMHEGRGQESVGVMLGKWIAFLVIGIAVIMVLFDVILPAVVGT